MKHVLRTAGILTIAVSACVILIVLLMSAANTIIVVETEPADFLPADHTVALFTNVSEEVLRKFETMFPALGDIPPTPNATVALLRSEEELLTAQFGDAGTQEGEHIFGLFSVTASDERVFDLLRTSTPRLRSLPAYLALNKVRVQRSPWIFLDLNAIPAPQTLSQKLAWLPVPPGSTHATIMLEGDRTQFSFAPVERAPKQGLPPSITSVFSGSILVARFANAPQSFQYLLDASDDGVRSLLEGTVRRLTEEYFSNEVSFQYDILPLLHGPVSLHLGTHASSGVVALEGVASGSRELAQRLDTLHRGFETKTEKFRITERSFDGRFSSKDIRIDATPGSHEDYEYLHWKVRVTRAADGTVFVTAMRGATFALSNNEAALKELLTEEASISPPSSSQTFGSIRLADGIAELQELQALLMEHFPMILEDKPLPFPMVLTGALLWSVEQRESTVTLTFK